MFLKALELQGFKSFPDKTKLDFEKGMTAVVGPNGSGKSNISDAVRWVLGEQKTKNLRSSKMEDVIFIGTSERKAQGFAQVTLIMDNSDRALNIDSDEVIVTRRYYRSGESEYKINKKNARLKDIHEMFMDTGLGRDGYSLVSQGKIADMVSSKSTERREMFEEAAGISHFRYRRGDAVKRLDQTQENLVRLKDILTELEGRVEPLRIQSEKAQEFLVLAEKKKQIEISLWLYTIDKLKEKLKEQEDKIALATAQHNDCETDLNGIEEQIEDIIKKTQGIAVAIEEIRNGMSTFEEQAAKLDSDVAVAKNTIEHNNETIERINKDMEQSSEDALSIDDNIKKASEQVEKCNELVNQKQTEIKDVYEQSQALAKQNDENADKSNELSKKLSDLSMKLADTRVKQSTAQSATGEISSRLQVINDQISGRDDLASKLQQEKDRVQKEISDIDEKIESLTNSINGYNLRVEKREEKFQKQKQELENMSIEIRQKESKCRMLFDLEKNMEGYSGSVKAVMRESKKGAIRGIHGPLSQLIKVEDKYAVAVETALGAAIQNIVVDSESDAKRAIKFLKERRVGRATFLPISSIRGRQLNENGLDGCLGYIDIASNLVKTDEKYSKIIKAQLARTVVVEDLDSAIAIAKRFSNRFRIVTLDGQVMNAGGSMTGGSRVNNSGILSRSNQIETIKQDIEKLNSKYKEYQEIHNSLNQELSSAKAQLVGAQSELRVCNEDKIKSQSKLTLVQGQIKTANESYEELLQEKKSSEQRIEELKSQIEIANKEITEITNKIDELEKEISVMTGNRQSLAQKREELSKMASDINLKILSYQKDISANEEIISDLNNRKLAFEGKEEELKREINQINLKNEEQEKLIEDLTLKATAFREKGKSSSQEIERLIGHRKGLDEQSGKLRLLERQKSSERENISGELARLEERKATMMREYDDTMNKLFDEYQLTHREAKEVSEPSKEPQKDQRQISEIKSKIRGLGSVNVGAIEEYKEVSERYEFMSSQIEDIEKSRQELIKLIEELTSNMSKQFTAQFEKINKNFSETFTHLFGGGKAELILEDEQDVLECGIEIKVQPPGKNVQNIDLFSGGEKGLAAIALLFAILKVTPAPFCIFDEVEAALDDVNVSRYAQYVRTMTDKTQFILITHRRGTMDEADRLYGVTMQEHGVSKLLELKTAELAKKLGITN